MTTQEVYNRACAMATKPVGALYYAYKDRKGKIQLGKSLWFYFREDCHSFNIEMLKVHESQHGFMFWNIDDRGDEFTIGDKREDFSNIVLTQKQR